MTIIAGLTDPGHRGGENQDSVAWDEARSLAFVADGLGGHASGQVASGIVKQTVLELVGPVDLLTAVRRAHAAVAEAAEKNPQYHGMASTIVAVQVDKPLGTVVWVGDSRAYLWRQQKISRLTRDHSVVEQLRETAGLSETQLFNHPQRNEVTNVLGVGEALPESRGFPLHRGDWILLCSDGLSGELRDHEIAQVLKAAPSIGKAAEALIAAALEKGGRDNVSAVLVAYDGPTKRDFSVRLSDTTITYLAVLGGVMLAAFLAGLLWFRSRP